MRLLRPVVNLILVCFLLALTSSVFALPSLTIQNVSQGSTVSGELLVTVQLPDNSYNHPYSYGDVRLSVDGAVVGYGGDLQFQTSAGPAVNISLPTDSFANGTHTLTASDATGFATSDTKTTTFTNDIYSIEEDDIFDPTSSGGGQAGDGVPTGEHIKARLRYSRYWRVAIKTTTDTPTTVRSWSGNSDTIDITWDGKRDITSGSTDVEDDTYEVVITVLGAITNVAQGSSAPGSSGSSSTSRIATKHSIGDVLLMFDTDKSIFPGGIASYRTYKNSILRKLSPYIGSSINKPTVLAIPTGAILSRGGFSGSGASRINAALRRPLRLFYVVCHGGSHIPINSLGFMQPASTHNPYFVLGGVTWYAHPIDDPNQHAVPTPFIYNMRDMVAPAGYGATGNNPPGIVWIDSCDSATGTVEPFGAPNTGSDNFSFGEAFHSGDLFGIFLGWNGYSVNYGAYAPPNDDWTFWRETMWTHLLNTSNNYTKAFNNTVRDYRVHGYGSIFPYTGTPEYRARIFGNGSDAF